MNISWTNVHPMFRGNVVRLAPGRVDRFQPTEAKAFSYLISRPIQTVAARDPGTGTNPCPGVPLLCNSRSAVIRQPEAERRVVSRYHQTPFPTPIRPDVGARRPPAGSPRSWRSKRGSASPPARAGKTPTPESPPRPSQHRATRRTTCRPNR